MRTEAQIEASRINGAKSKGPITPEGKAVSSKNGIKTGQYASFAGLLSKQDPEEFDHLREQIYLQTKPENEAELILVERIVLDHLRLHHIEKVYTYACETSENEPDTTEETMFKNFDRIAKIIRSRATLQRCLKTSTAMLENHRKQEKLKNEPKLPSAPTAHRLRIMDLQTSKNEPKPSSAPTDYGPGTTDLRSKNEPKLPSALMDYGPRTTDLHPSKNELKTPASNPRPQTLDPRLPPDRLNRIAFTASRPKNKKSKKTNPTVSSKGFWNS